MTEPENEYQKALCVINGYYTVLADEMAKEILEIREDFESPGYGGTADDLIGRYARQIQQLGMVYSILRWKAHRKKPEANIPLGKYEFRCFGCGGIIHSNEEACQICGWIWR